MMLISKQQADTYRQSLPQVKRWVVKIGSAMLTNGTTGADDMALADWAGQMAALQKTGKQVVLVSSGAVAVGMQQLNWQRRPTQLSALQSAAAVGQMSLSNAWQQAFSAYGIQVAQILLTHDDAADRKRYLNIRSTLKTLCQLGIIPVVNENDTVSFDEIRFGDNDNLGAMVANISGAGGYIILTDQEGMYNQNPRKYPDAQLISAAAAADPNLLSMADKKGSMLGSGGMYSKVLAAQKAARSGTHTLLAYGRKTQIITRLAAGEAVGTLFAATDTPQQARKQWLSSQLQIQGRLILDIGAIKAITVGNKSLLSVGITAVEGEFSRGALIACYGENGREVARGLCNYDSQDICAVQGKNSDEAAAILIHGDAVIHRDNMVITVG